MQNAQIADLFDQIADLLEMQDGDAFRIRSYRSAARTLRDLPERVEDLVAQKEDLTKIPNIGKSTAEKILEILKTGSCKRLKELKKKFPPHLSELMQVPNLGPKKTMLLHETLGVNTLPQLRAACEKHRVAAVPGMGERTEARILQGLNTLRTAAGRHPHREAAGELEALGRHLDAAPSIRKWQVAGSFRRGLETIGDLDVLVQAKDRDEAADAIAGYPDVQRVESRGAERVTVRLRGGINVDFRFFEPEAFGAALLYFTGSKAHNIALRKRVVKRGLKLNEYGLFRGKKRLAGKTEEEIYRALKLAYVDPELREDRGELEAAEKGKLPRLVGLEDLRGDLHSHTKETDGTETILAMAKAARARGYSYLAITDHSKAVTIAKGMDEKRMRKHADAIRKADASLDRFWLLAGVEVDILKDGRLDLPEKVLADLDWVVASVHTRYSLDEKKMTDRVCAAIESGVVHCVGHPFGRLIGEREPMPLDFDRILEACRKHHVCLEINSQPERLDLPDVFAKRAKEAGVGIVIATDAHKVSDLDFIRYGVTMARRGWLSKKDVLNTATLSSLRKRLKR